jgi:hypothetical protein
MSCPEPTSSAEGSPASPSASPAGAEAKRMNDGYGPRSSELFAIFIPDGSCSRTFPAFCPPGPLDDKISAYVAGLVDGDGSIWIQRGRTTQLYPKISIRLGWKGRQTLQELQACFGGYMGLERRPANPKHSEVFHWTVTGKTAVPVLQHIYPFLRIKRAQAAIALHLAAIWASRARNRYQVCLPLWELMRVLNQTGPEHALPVEGHWLLVPEIRGSSEKQPLRWSQTWPRAGSMVSGIAFRRAPSAPLTRGTASGSWPTPQTSYDGRSDEAWLTAKERARERHQAGLYAKGTGPPGMMDLQRAVRMFPTPSASSYGTNQGGGMGRVGPVRPSLETMARHGLWPTPTARDATSGPGHADSAEGSPNLRTAVTWPTPTAWDAGRGAGWDGPGRPPGETAGGPLNPEWVEALMGLPRGWTDLGNTTSPGSPEASPTG